MLLSYGSSPLYKSEQLTPKICRVYQLYLSMIVKNQDELWVAHVICKTLNFFLFQALQVIRYRCYISGTVLKGDRVRRPLFDSYF